MKGKSEVAFSKYKGAGKNRRRRYYSDEETYFKELTYVIGGRYGHVYFSFSLYYFQMGPMKHRLLLVNMSFLSNSNFLRTFLHLLLGSMVA